MIQAAMMSDILLRSVEYDIKTAGGFDIVGIDVVTTNENDKAAEDINALWLRFFEEAVGDKIPNRTGQEIYCAYTDYQGDHTKPYRVLIGCKSFDSSAATDGLKSLHIPSRRYAVFQSIGEQPQSLIKTWKAIWEMPSLPRSFGCDYEVYGPRFFEPGLHEVMINIGLEDTQ